MINRDESEDWLPANFSAERELNLAEMSNGSKDLG